MAPNFILTDRWGNPVKKPELKREVAAPTFGGTRSPLPSSHLEGLTPLKLTAALRAADQGDPLEFLALADLIEGRDMHFAGIMGTRKRSVSQLTITVEPASDSAADEQIAQELRDWIDRDELREEVFDILDAIGKGYSHTEIIWDTSMGQWQPAKLEWRDPRWFRFDRVDLATPTMLDNEGAEVPYPAFKFIFTQMKSKSGTPLTTGLARVALWGYLFKKFTERDWAIFTQTYGQPIRVGRFGAGASEKDRDTLFDAVANIGGDCAAIIPDSMMIEFVSAQNVSGSIDLYERRADWFDKQMSKLVLGQTSTTDAEVGGLGSGKEHREVQLDIEAADAGMLQAAINRDLIRPWVQLNHPDATAFPKIKIERVEEEDLKLFADAITPFIDRGLRVSEQDVREKFGLRDPTAEERILGPSAKSAPQTPPEPDDGDGTARESAVKYPFNTLKESEGTDTALQSQSASAGLSGDFSEVTDQLVGEGADGMEGMLTRIEAMVDAAGSLEELREMLIEAFPDIDASAVSAAIAKGLVAVHAAGRVAIAETPDG